MVNCNNSNSNTPDYALIAASNNTYNFSQPGLDTGDFGLEGPSPADRMNVASQIAIIACKPSYSVFHGTVTQNNSMSQVILDPSASARQLPGLSPWDIMSSVYNALGNVQSSGYLGNKFGYAANNVSELLKHV